MSSHVNADSLAYFNVNFDIFPSLTCRIWILVEIAGKNRILLRPLIPFILFRFKGDPSNNCRFLHNYQTGLDSTTPVKIDSETHK